MIFEHSYWWILPALLLSVAVAYFKFKKLAGLPDIPRGISVLVALLRFLVVFMLCVLLLNPALSVLRHIKEKPLLIVAQDNSQSILKNKDSLYYRNEYRASLEKILNNLEHKFEVVPLTFGSAVRRNGTVTFSENRTDMAGLLEYVDRNFIARRPEAMVLLSDGICNAGVNPLYRQLSFPLYTVGLGDTVCYPDVYIRSVDADKFNFLNTLFPIKVELAALKQKGREIKCVLRENGKAIAEQKVRIDKENFLSELTFEVEAKKKGIIRYEIELETGFEERTQENNRTETWVHIIDNSADIAFVAAAPHPDIAAIVQAVNVSGIYRCREHRLDESWDTLKANLVILHNPDAGDRRVRQLVEEADRRKIALWCILTERKHMTDFSRYTKHYQVNFNSDLNEYATVQTNGSFPYFEFTDEEMAGFAKYPPLTVPFGEINPLAGRVLFNQAIKNMPTRNGMIAFYEQADKRTAYFWGEGLWRWRLYSYQENGNHELFDTFIQKVVGYLATKKSDERFLHDIKPVYGELEEAVVNVELYNDSYELVNKPEVKLDLTHNEKTFTYSLNRNGEKYRINLGNLSAGEYTYRLSTDLKGETFHKKGVFYVRNHNPELNDVVADRELLRALAENSGGRFYDADELDRLEHSLETNDKMKSVYKSETEFVNLSRLKTLGILILLLLCMEWFLLRYYAD